MRSAVLGAIVILGVFGASRVVAAPYYYTLTDLGATHTLQKDSGGTIHGVTNAAGTTTYAFEKTPVVVTDGPHETSWNPLEEERWTTKFQTQAGTYIAYTQHDYHGDYRTITRVTDNYVWGTVFDANIRGQFLGAGTDGYLKVVGVPGYTLSMYPLIQNPVPDPGFYLKAGGAIDDLGRVLAQGSNGETYLLTPQELGPPQTVPEPTVLALAGLVSLGAASRAAVRRGRIWRTRRNR